MTDKNTHQQQHNLWLTRLGVHDATLEPLAGDLSTRRYTRVLAQGRSFILASYPDDTQKTQSRFLKTSTLLSEVGVRVPVILANDLDAGLMLLEDAGKDSLYPNPPAGTLEEAGTLIKRFQQIPVSSVQDLNPNLDQALFMRELEQTWEVYLEPQGLDPERGLGAELAGVLQQVCTQLDQPDHTVVCHRDFMARNLLLTNCGELVVLDHQDLRPGPATYDLASLLNDSVYPEDSTAVAMRRAHGCAPGEEREEDYDLAVVQRTFKILGTFHKFARLGISRYLPLVPQTLERALRHLASLEDLDGPALAKALSSELSASALSD